MKLICGDGVWHGEDGSRFLFSLDLRADGGRCEGTIRWGLESTDDEHAESGTEFVRGSVDANELRLYGYRLDNPELLSLDEYRLTLWPEGGGFEGASRGAWGTWRNVLAGRLRA